MALGLFKKKEPKSETDKGAKSVKVQENLSNDNTKLQIKVDLLKEEINALKEREKLVDERLSRINESVGEIRGMSLNTEKDSKELSIKAEEAISIIKETKPEKTSEKLEKFDQKIEKQKIILESYKALLDAFEEKNKKINEKLGLIKGAETLLNLNKEIREELLSMKKLEAKIERDADRVESIYITYQKEFSELKDIKEQATDIEKLQKEMVKEIDEVKIKIKTLIGKKDFENIKTKLDKTTEKITKVKKWSDETKKNMEKTEEIVNKLTTKYTEPEKLTDKFEDLRSRMRTIETKVRKFTLPTPKQVDSVPFEEVKLPETKDVVVKFKQKPKKMTIFDEIQAEKQGKLLPETQIVDNLEKNEMEIENSITLIGQNPKSARLFLMKIEKNIYELSQKGLLTQQMVYAVLNELNNLTNYYGKQAPVSQEILQTTTHLQQHYNIS